MSTVLGRVNPNVPVFGKDQVCRKCRGSGVYPNHKDNVCAKCHGRGFHPVDPVNKAVRVASPSKAKVPVAKRRR